MTKDRDANPTGKPAGRVDFDSRGNAIWRPLDEVSSQSSLIRMLKIDELSIKEGENTQRVKKVKTEHVEGYNPYNKAAACRIHERPKKKDLRALSDWIEMKKRLESDKK
jgi:hypothetical protein